MDERQTKLNTVVTCQVVRREHAANHRCLPSDTGMCSRTMQCLKASVPQLRVLSLLSHLEIHIGVHHTGAGRRQHPHELVPVKTMHGGSGLSFGEQMGIQPRRCVIAPIRYPHELMPVGGSLLRVYGFHSLRAQVNTHRAPRKRVTGTSLIGDSGKQEYGRDFRSDQN